MTPGAASPQNFQRNSQDPVPLVDAPNATQLFMKCLAGCTEKRLPNLNPNIFRTDESSKAPRGFVQKIPDQAYRQAKRGSVFQKIDLSVLDSQEIPSYSKTDEELKEILPLL